LARKVPEKRRPSTAPPEADAWQKTGEKPGSVGTFPILLKNPVAAFDTDRRELYDLNNDCSAEVAAVNRTE